MKNLIKISAIAAFFLVSLTSMAPVPTNGLVIGEDGKSLYFHLGSYSEASTVKITDKTANTLFYANVSGKNYVKKFNLEQLETGTYYFVVDNPQSSVAYTLSIKDNKVAIIHKEEKTTSPVFRVVGEKVLFSLSNKDLKNLEIKITNSKNLVVFKEDVSVEGSLDKVFNFEKASKDQYTITIKDGNTTHKKRIEIG
jgi:hypothetical protein